MIVLGIILLLIGYFLGISLLEVVGVILLVVGAILFAVGAGGSTVGGRRYWY